MKLPFASLFPRFVLRFAERLRFPQLFLLALTLFVLDLLLPDMIPFVDEILLALATLILSALRRGGSVPAAAGPTRSPDSGTIDGKAVRLD